MKLLFLDPIAWDYHPGSVATTPLGGSQSSLCYLMQELARRGHHVLFLNRGSFQGTVHGIRCGALTNVPLDFVEPATACIVLNPAVEDAPRIRRLLHPATPLVLWTQHMPDQLPMQRLVEPAVHTAWDEIVVVSQTHRRAIVEACGVAQERMTILPNAIAPAFEGLFASRDDLARAKSGPPRLAYTSTPFRGLALLPGVFHAVRTQVPQAELDVYSSMRLYQEPPERDPHRDLYEELSRQPGVHYHEPFPEPELARALREVSILAYPNTFAEGFAVAVHEAMAAGLYVVTSRLGAFPEVLHGWALLVDPPRDQQDLHEYARRYTLELLEVLRAREQNPSAFAERQWEQVQVWNEHCTWSRRAQQWEHALARWHADRRSRKEA